MTRTIAVIGCGLIGQAWTVVFARAGCDVRVWDPVAQVRDALPALLDEMRRWMPSPHQVRSWHRPIRLLSPQALRMVWSVAPAF